MKNLIENLKDKKIIIVIGVVMFFVLLVAIFAVVLSQHKDYEDPFQKMADEAEKAEKELILDDMEKPYISITPQSDGHRLDLKITNIPESVTQIEYDLIYSAKDEDFEIEKGVGGTAEIEGTSFERELLLGTESCTNGCKYKYDEGITGGTLTLNLLTANNKSAFFEAPFTFDSSSTIKANGGLSLESEDLEIKATVTSKNEYFILVKNYQPVYSVFSSGTGAGKISSISPETVTKKDTTLITGDYVIE